MNYIVTLNVMFLFDLAGLNQGQKALQSLPAGVSSSFKGSPHQSPWPFALCAAKGDVENWLVEFQSCETSLSPFSNEFPDHQISSRF